MSKDNRAKILKRYAFQIMPQLPEDADDAHAVVDYLHHLIEWTCNGGKAPPPPFERRKP